MIHGAKHLRAFLAVARLNSFTRAANELHISQPALSVQIKQLEESLKVMLFHRNQREVRLSSDGQRLLPEIENLYKNIQQLFDPFEESHPQVRLRIAALPSVAAAVLPQILPKFRQQYPYIQLEIYDGVDVALLQKVKNNEVEFALGTPGSPQKGIHYRAWMDDHMSVYYPVGHDLEKLKAPSLKEIMRYPQITTTLDTSVRKIVDAALESQKLQMELAVESSYMSTASALVHAGLGVAILPSSAVHAISMQGIKHKKINEVSLNRRLMIIQNQLYYPSKAAQLLIRALIDFAVIKTATLTY